MHLPSRTQGDGMALREPLFRQEPLHELLVREGIDVLVDAALGAEGPRKLIALRVFGLDFGMPSARPLALPSPVAFSHRVTMSLLLHSSSSLCILTLSSISSTSGSSDAPSPAMYCSRLPSLGSFARCHALAFSTSQCARVSSTRLLSSWRVLSKLYFASPSPKGSKVHRKMM